MFVENFNEMYAKISEIRKRNTESILTCHDNPLNNDMYMTEFCIKTVRLVQHSIDRLRELGVPDFAMTFTVTELAVLSEMPGFDIKIRWIRKDTFYRLTQQ